MELIVFLSIIVGSLIGLENSTHKTKNTGCLENLRKDSETGCNLFE